MNRDVPVATLVDEPVKRVQIPHGMRPGDSFVVTEFGTPFTVVVPEGVTGGSFVNVYVPQEATVVESDSKGKFKVDKSMAGAAVVGGVVGLVLFGPIVGAVLAGGAAFAASQKNQNNDVGKAVRKAGKETFKAMEKGKKWVEKNIVCIDADR